MNTSDADNIIPIEQGRQTRQLGRSRRRIDQDSLTVRDRIMERTYHDLAIGVDALDFLHDGATIEELRTEAERGRDAMLAILRSLSPFRPSDDDLMGRIRGGDDEGEDGQYYNAMTVVDVLERHTL